MNLRKSGRPLIVGYQERQYCKGSLRVHVQASHLKHGVNGFGVVKLGARHFGECSETYRRSFSSGCRSQIIFPTCSVLEVHFGRQHSNSVGGVASFGCVFNCVLTSSVVVCLFVVCCVCSEQDTSTELRSSRCTRIVFWTCDRYAKTSGPCLGSQCVKFALYRRRVKVYVSSVDTLYVVSNSLRCVIFYCQSRTNRQTSQSRFA